MGKMPRRFREWEMNEILDIIFLACYRDDFMVIFKDGDLHEYADERKKRMGVRTRRETGIPLSPQKFRPDGVLLDRQGRAYILETKLGSGLSSKASHTELVVQALVYASVFISPAWEGKPPWDAYPFLDVLHHAYWNANRRFAGSCPDLREEHRLHFGLPTPLQELQFERVPYVIFLLEQFDEERLLDACNAAKQPEFADFARYAESTLTKGSRFRKRLGKLKANWALLQQAKFILMDLNTSVLQSLASAPRELL
jgi:hypothetical protein